MRKVKIAYSPDRNLVGKEQELEDGEAGQLVREGRAVYVDTDGDADTATTSNTDDAGSSRPKKTAAKADPTAEVAKK